ncbi:hypothetical protein [Spongiactinospora gelatinilytica]|uniref:hypothetical protein n=1 Tax=Spongiactinospora gelatinilytica TaxID=2666298 RepID=UPI0011B943A9|nr:hypothetical protein [Spongiactinospora gelatinilytica]
MLERVADASYAYWEVAEQGGDAGAAVGHDLAVMAELAEVEAAALLASAGRREAGTRAAVTRAVDGAITGEMARCPEQAAWWAQVRVRHLHVVYGREGGAAARVTADLGVPVEEVRQILAGPGRRAAELRRVAAEAGTRTGAEDAREAAR